MFQVKTFLEQEAEGGNRESLTYLHLALTKLSFFLRKISPFFCPVC